MWRLGAEALKHQLRPLGQQWEHLQLSTLIWGSRLPEWQAGGSEAARGQGCRSSLELEPQPTSAKAHSGYAERERDADPLFSTTPHANPSQSGKQFFLKRAAPALLELDFAKSMINMQWIQSAGWGARSWPGCRIPATF